MLACQTRMNATAVAEAIRRDKELSSGDVAGRTHEKVMQAARTCSNATDLLSPRLR
ncbi:MAG: hypothetical protein QOF62_2661 [Pyrinomonadaceae bacterium]|jgi:hypothetical protein|nr:hypothetical protein [Pyrinomonadaceae bacterium]